VLPPKALQAVGRWRATGERDSEDSACAHMNKKRKMEDRDEELLTENPRKKACTRLYRKSFATA